MTDKVNSYHAW